MWVKEHIACGDRNTLHVGQGAHCMWVEEHIACGDRNALHVG
jgi:hypothetical protein